MVQIRKPTRRSVELYDRRTNTGNTPSELRSRAAAETAREVELMLKQEAAAAVRRVRAMRRRQGR